MRRTLQRSRRDRAQRRRAQAHQLRPVEVGRRSDRLLIGPGLR